MTKTSLQFLVRNIIPGALPTVPCVTRATRFWIRFLCVLTSWMPPQVVITCSVVSLIEGSVVPEETMHER